MNFLTDTFFILLASLLSYIAGNRTFKKVNLESQVNSFFYIIKNDYDLFLVTKSYFKSDNDILISDIGDKIYNYTNLTPYFTNEELKLYNKINLLLLYKNSDEQEIINCYISLINLVRVRYNKITKLYFFPKWEE